VFRLVLLHQAEVLADGVADVLDGVARELARGVDASPEAGHGRAALELGDLGALDIGDQ
jgi:hypothetical protein